MAVYTTLEHEEIAELIEPFGIGELLSYEGINHGMENTNYFLITSSTHLGTEVSENIKGQYVLTIFEELPESHLPFHLKCSGRSFYRCHTLLTPPDIGIIFLIELPISLFSLANTSEPRHACFVEFLSTGTWS